MACSHDEVLRTYNMETGVQTSEGHPRVWKCSQCGKTSTDINSFNGEE